MSMCCCQPHSMFVILAVQVKVHSGYIVSIHLLLSSKPPSECRVEKWSVTLVCCALSQYAFLVGCIVWGCHSLQSDQMRFHTHASPIMCVCVCPCVCVSVCLQVWELVVVVWCRHECVCVRDHGHVHVRQPPIGLRNAASLPQSVIWALRCVKGARQWLIKPTSPLLQWCESNVWFELCEQLQ